MYITSRLESLFNFQIRNSAQRFMSLGGGASHGHDRSDSMEALQRSLREVFVKSAS